MRRIVPNLKIKEEDDKLFSKRLTTHHVSSIANFPMEDIDDHYLGVSTVAVPFTWESQPGTPKTKLRETSLPPLTPPPSYFYTTAKKRTKNNRCPKSNLFNAIFPKHVSRKTRLSSSPPSPSTSSSSSSSSQQSSRWSTSSCIPSSSVMISKSQGRSSGQSFDSRTMMDAEGEELESSSPVSTLCFGFGRGTNGRDSPRGCCASTVKMLIRDVHLLKK